MKKTNILLTVLILALSQVLAQKKAFTFSEAEKHGVSIQHLDSIYQSAVHADSSIAVFKTEKEQEALQAAYRQLLQDFGKFLSQNNFYWQKPTRCFNRIYFSADGSIDYFVFNFLGKIEDKPNERVQSEFQRLLSMFIATYQFPLTAKTKFAQCSPTTYQPKN